MSPTGRATCRRITGRRPTFRIRAEAEKGHRDRYLPMTPDFAEWLLQTPESDSHDRVFKLVGLRSRIPLTPRRVGRIVSQLGKRARVTVNEDGKPASAHDLRRSFGTRWAVRVKPATLQLLIPEQPGDN